MFSQGGEHDESETHEKEIFQEALQLYNSMTSKQHWDAVRVHGNVTVEGRLRQYELDRIDEYFEEWDISDPNDQDEDDEDEDDDRAPRHSPGSSCRRRWRASCARPSPR